MNDDTVFIDKNNQHSLTNGLRRIERDLLWGVVNDLPDVKERLNVAKNSLKLMQDETNQELKELIDKVANTILETIEENRNDNPSY